MPFDSLPELPIFPVVVEDEIGLTLRKARQLVQQGWCKGQLHQFHEKYCVAGAIRMAAGWKKNKLHNEVIQLFAQSLPPVYYKSTRNDLCAVMKWNDISSRTQYEVLAQFDKVIHRSMSR